MFFRQILHEDLGCASYLVADEGEAAVVDPKWEINEYVRLAAGARAEIRHVLETHTHADHVSGRARLVSATGATAHVPADPADPTASGLRHGDVVTVGRVRIEALAAPGHRPEHLAYVVYDDPRDAGLPCLVLSGDSLLVGDVGRPDLAVAPAEGATALFDTLQRLVALGDGVEVWPAHVGGSLCGSSALSERPSSTIGYERGANPLLTVEDRDEFVSALTSSIPSRPPRVQRIVGLNRTGAEPPAPLEQLEPEQLGELISGSVCVLDVRTPPAFDAGHLRGALNLPLDSKALGTRAGWCTALDETIVVVAEHPADCVRAAERLYAAGVWSLIGLAAADLPGWRAIGLPVQEASMLTPERLVCGLRGRELRLLDVRNAAEWRAGHVAQSLHLPLPELGDGRDVTVPDDQPLAVACATGGRAALAASVLRRRGYDPVARVSGGIPDLRRYGMRLVGGES